MSERIIAANENFTISLKGLILGNFSRYNPIVPKIRGIKKAPKPNPLLIIILARKCPLFPDQFFTAISGPETISESAMLRSVFHQNRYATQARRRYNAKPVMRIPTTNLILSSVNIDLLFTLLLAGFETFLPASSFSLF